ncbi:hypothetical protein N3K66_007089 [Trichothecium roseum]|uniref:Uncharacterized protein n=1 Tax=Trichothecium roseum TaxID=47278 RepID=A0ACC0UXA2_9HYPO|nr:hypothetical protein N3K66_007089 [Trichothecium roseum]
MADEFDAQTSNFLAWFKNLPGATFSDSIEIADLRSRGAGRGIVATRDIPADTTLFTIPRGSIISTETSEVARRLPQVFDLSAVLEDEGEDAGAGLDSWACLILVLFHEHLRGGASPWKPYLDVALPPTRAFDTPMFWSGAELAELQSGPAAGKIGRAEAEDMFRNKIIPVAREHEREDASLFPGVGAMTEEELVELAHRVGSSIMAYAFDLEPEGGEGDEGEEQEGWVEDREGRSLMGMVPMADMLNADAEFNAHINHGDDALTATTLRDIRAGEEVLNYYGPHPNSELLRRYGYVTGRHARYDVVEVPWALIEQAVAEQLGLPTDVVEKARGLLDEDEIEDTFVLERTTPDPGPDGTFPADAPPVAFTSPPPDLAEQLKAFLKAAKKVRPGSGVEDKRKRDEVAQSALVRCLGVLEGAYATTLEQDEALLAACAEEGNSSSSDRRKRMALVVRMGEKRLIREAREVLGAGESSEEGRAKRTKLDG